MKMQCRVGVNTDDGQSSSSLVADVGPNLNERSFSIPVSCLLDHIAMTMKVFPNKEVFVYFYADKDVDKLEEEITKNKQGDINE